MVDTALLNNLQTVFNLGVKRLVEKVLPRELRSQIDKNIFADQARGMSEELCAKIETDLSTPGQQRVAAKAASVAESMITDREDFDELNKTYELVQQALSNVTGIEKKNLLEETRLETDLHLNEDQLREVFHEYFKLTEKEISQEDIDDAIDGKSIDFDLGGEDFYNQSILELAATIGDL